MSAAVSLRSVGRVRVEPSQAAKNLERSREDRQRGLPPSVPRIVCRACREEIPRRLGGQPKLCASCREIVSRTPNPRALYGMIAFGRISGMARATLESSAEDTADHGWEDDALFPGAYDPLWNA